MKFEFNTLRLEFALLAFLSAGLSIYYYQSINWLDYIILFALIDAIGYIPGRLWCIVNKKDVPPKLFYWAYNFCHNLGFSISVAVIYWEFIDNNPAILALFVHQFSDRGILGNFLKKEGNPYHFPTSKLIGQ